MFKKLKDKIEEVRQTSPRLPVQSLSQNDDNTQSMDEEKNDSHYSPFRANKTSEDGDVTNAEENNGKPLIDFGAAVLPTDHQSMTPTTNVTDEETAKLSANFEAVDLSEASAMSTPNLIHTRTSSESSFQSEVFTTYTPPAHTYHPQSDIESASEFEDASPNLDQVSKSQIYQAFQTTRSRYHRYRAKYQEVIKLYREQEAEKEKIKNILSENQDKALRRIAELKEESQLEKHAKADLEDSFRLMLDEKDEVINVLQTQVRLLKTRVPPINAAESNSSTPEPSDNAVTDENGVKTTSSVNTEKLLEKNKKLESLLSKCKDTMKANKEKITNLLTEKENLQKQLEFVQKTLEEKTSQEQTEKVQSEELNNVKAELDKITEENTKLQETIKNTDEKFHSEMSNKNHDLLSSKKEIDDLQCELSKIKNENDKLNEELKELSLKTIQSDEVILKLQNKNSEENEIIAKKLEQLENKIQEITAEKVDLESRLFETDTKWLSFANEVKALKSGLTEYNDIGSKINDSLPNAEFGSIEDVYRGLYKITEILHSEIDVLYCKLHHSSDAAAEMSENWARDKETLVTKLQDMKHRLIKSENENTDLNFQVTNYKQQVTNATLELQKQQFSCNNVLQENEHLSKLQDEYISKLTNYEKELEAKEQEISQMLTERFALEETVNGLQQELRTVKRRSIEEPPELMATKEENQNLGMLIGKLEKELSEKDSTVNELRDEINLQSAMRTSSSEVEENLKRKLQEAKDLTVEKESVIYQLQYEKEECYKLYDSTRALYESKIQECNEQMAKELDNFKENEKLLQQEVEKIKQQHFSDRDIILQELNNLRDYKSELEILVDFKSQEIAEFRNLLPEICDILKISFDDLNQDISSLPKQIKENLNSKQESIVNEMQNLKENHKKVLQDLRDKTSLAIDVFREKINSLQEELLKQKEDFETCKTQLQIESNEKLAKLKEQLEIDRDNLVTTNECVKELVVVRGQLEEKQIEIERMKFELIAYKEQNESFSNKEIALRQSLENAEKLLESDSTEVGEMKIELQSCQNQNVNLLREREELCNKITAQEDEKVSLIASFEEVKKLHLEKEEKIKELESHVKHLSEKLETSVMEYKNLQVESEEKLKGVLNTLNSKDEQLQRLQNEILEITEKYNLGKELNDNNNNRIEKLEIDITRLEQSLEEKTSIHQNLIEENKKLKDEIEQTQDKCNVQVNGYIQQVEDVNQKMEDLKKKAEQRLAQIKKQFQTFHSDALKLKSDELQKLQEEMQSIESSRKLEMQEKSENECNFRELTDKLEHIVKEKEQVDLMCGEIRKQLEEKVIELENSQQVFNNEQENLQQKIEELQKEKTEKVEELTHLIDVNGMLKEQLKMLENEKENEIMKLVDKHKEEMDVIQKELDIKNAQIDESLLLAQENTMEMEKSLEKTKLEMKKIVTKLKKREEEVEELKTRLQKSVENEKCSEEMDKLKIQLQAVEQEKSEIEDKYHQLEISVQNERVSEDLEKEYERKIANLEEEQTDKIKQLVSDLTQQLQSKDQEHEETLFATIEKLQNEKSQMQKEYQNQIQEMVSDLREKETALDNLIATRSDELKERDDMWTRKLEENENRIKLIQKEHSEKIQELNDKSKLTLNRQLEEQSEKYEEEIRGLSKEWNQERKLEQSDDAEKKELEEQNRLTIAAMESSSGNSELLRQEVISQTRDIANLKAQHKNEMYQLQVEISRLQRLLESTTKQLQVTTVSQGPLLNEPTQMEYLRNILFEYMMGRETTTLSKVIAAVVKFSEYQTQKVLEREESRHNVLAHLLKN